MDIQGHHDLFHGSFESSEKAGELQQLASLELY
jgi:hypothetical protein